jgi:hypothetical protein
VGNTHPIVEPLRKWLSEHEASLDSTTLGEPRRFNQYLENRLREAYQAAWDAHERYSQQHSEERSDG